MENITASEIAGLGVGALLFCATVAAPKIDSLISASQRSSLGMCKGCGDLRMIACSRCKGLGMVKGEPFNLSIVEDLYQSFVGGEVTARSVPCTKCQAKGCFSCPDCS
ncbi:Chaperone DnaJ 2 [Cinnamomum micranthum f. kanehirae]|uniref:Chaperone DnaJ 2 n=1 Tax=Cinnamomum micranthum f. kanehirae TaxID=337451 RepID=A0A3S3MNK2_9MAGN|nr:Chaperone DnaJ 2 [Cinnamomum micranthum f. kanehirae]